METDTTKYLDENLSFEERVKDLVSRMTLKEKVSQMIHKSCAIPRLGIPSYNWWNEALHGVARAGVSTMFPQAIGMAATFDDQLIKNVADVVATEGRAKHHEYARKNDRGIYKGLTFWSPNINIFRDPRWGRGHETYGEDPFLSGKLGVSYIHGLQGDHTKYLKTAACAKHFAVHSGPEAERHEFNAEVSKKDLYETYLPAFRDCVIEGKAESVMGAYNAVNGEPCCGSKTLLQDILRGDWGFEGHVVSDCWAIKDFHEGHHVTKTEVESAAYGLNHGCDLNCGSMYVHLVKAYEKGMITDEVLDESVGRLMLTRMKLGMFDNPENVPFSDTPYELNDCPEHNELALEVSKKSLVLLKNEGPILPLNKNQLNSIAVIGPNAHSRAALVGNYEGTASEYVTVVDGIRETVNKDTRIYYAEGCHLFKEKMAGLDEPKSRFAEALAVAERADVVVICLGLDATIEGEEMHKSNDFGSGDKYNLELPGLQQELLEAIHRTGKPVILVNISGSALALNWADENVPAIVQAWYPGAQGGRAIASLLFGDYSPSGKLPVTFYRTTEELPDFRDYAMKNRTYRYMKNEALYPFGYGLSYTTFEYEPIEGVTQSVRAGENVEFTIKVKNTGEQVADEIVQLYVKDVEATVGVPNWELKGFRNVTLSPDEEREVSFTLTPRELSIINEVGQRILEPGKFEIYIGGSQPDQRSVALTGTEVLKYELEVTGNALDLEY
ncbi:MULTISPECIES: glycoside hydrolase family 3 C-terminal domain-containing protein [Bacillaceae]|uniref:Glycoside hydrolase family 3 C-terminal domain-containing protein n=1 Tax=Evansella alkalicola TaxID=745819 RepID=A0ABS6JUI8_9BACI|nr:MULTISPECIES: glycoside hydrolase family 3 C-terminal domain-containing protein [Bacillaceae]MBU9722211.1 glycoside hydrolase family 3 C-terminal domain-containing protein [Bacillus alkalicola]